MKRFLILEAVILLFAVAAQAGPINWAKHHKRFLAMEAVAGTAAFVHAKGLAHCRLGDVEHCDEGYGSAWAWYGILTGFSTAVGPAIAEGCWKSNPDAKFCNIFGYGFSGFQLGQGIRDWTYHNVCDPDAPCGKRATLRRIQFP